MVDVFAFSPSAAVVVAAVVAVAAAAAAAIVVVAAAAETPNFGIGQIAAPGDAFVGTSVDRNKMKWHHDYITG